MKKIIIGAVLFSLGNFELSALAAASKDGANKRKESFHLKIDRNISLRAS